MSICSRLSTCLLAVFALGASPRSPAQTDLSGSPFLPSSGTGQPGSPVPDENYQLSGISVAGKKTYISVYDNSTRHSSWIAVGATVGGVEAVSCDVKGNRAVVRAAGQLKVLVLRQPAAVAGGPATPGFTGNVTVALPTAPVAATSTAPLTEQAVQEREARMMVSDLLEIGQQQRKAYEEKKAALDAAARKDEKP